MLRLENVVNLIGENFIMKPNVITNLFCVVYRILTRQYVDVGAGPEPVVSAPLARLPLQLQRAVLTREVARQTHLVLLGARM